MARSIWDAVPIVEVFRPCCPFCRWEKYIPNRGKADEDGGRTSKRICKRCSRRYIVISELMPESGKTDEDVL